MKNKSQKRKAQVKKLFKYSGEEGYRHLGALMEDMHSDFRAFGEGLTLVKNDLTLVKEKGEATFEEVGRVKIQLSEMNIKYNVLKEDQKSIIKKIDSIENRIEVIEKKQNVILEDIQKTKYEIISIKNEITVFKKFLTQKADIARLIALEQKVFNIEKHLKLQT